MVTTATILIVEDDPTIVRLLEMMFQNINFHVHSTSLGENVVQLVQKTCPSLIILDIDLPDANGIDLISIIRQYTAVPIMMLSGKNTDIEKVTSFNYGADDYVVKPFSVAELIARVQGILRRTALTTSTETVQIDNIKETSSIQLDRDQHRVFIGNDELPLTQKEFQLLQMLLDYKGKVLSREIILDNIWGINNFDIDTRAVDACVSRLRKKVKSLLGKDVIEAIAGTGYRLSN